MGQLPVVSVLFKVFKALPYTYNVGQLSIVSVLFKALPYAYSVGQLPIVSMLFKVFKAVALCLQCGTVASSERVVEGV